MNKNIKINQDLDNLLNGEVDIFQLHNWDDPNQTKEAKEVWEKLDKIEDLIINLLELKYGDKDKLRKVLKMIIKNCEEV